jgi:hypothetical protein
LQKQSQEIRLDETEVEIEVEAAAEEKRLAVVPGVQAAETGSVVLRRREV